LYLSESGFLSLGGQIMTEAQAQSEVRTVGFVVVSSVLHVLLVLGILALKAEQTPPKETIQVEILGGSDMLSAPTGALTKAAASPVAKTIPVSEAPKKAAVSQAPDLSPKSTAKELATKDDVAAPIVKATPVAKTTPVMKAAPAVTAEQAKAATAEAPLETAALDEPKNISAAPTQQLNTDDFNKDFDQMDQNSDVKVAAVQKNLSDDTASALKDQQTQTEKLNEQTSAENAALTEQIAKTKAQAEAQQKTLAAQEATRERQAQAEAEQSAAATVAAEQAKADKAASEKAAKLAAEKAEADRVAAEKLAAEQAATDQAARENMLAAKAAAEKADADRMAAAQARADKLAAEQRAATQAAQAQQASAARAGVAASQVRSLNELRQMPGNSRPLYDADDRLNHRQGDVAFLAYISKEGQPVKFKMLQSSGYRELDSKTLKAIRNWKFYPGQEGWVEIPFRWDLKGGPQEMPATLRRTISQN
jgi:TonB family protein